jgi:hypothetical protein
MKYFYFFAFTCCVLSTSTAQIGSDTLMMDNKFERNDSLSYEERVNWINSVMDQHYVLLSKEHCNFGRLKPFLINNIKESDTYYAIEVIDSTKAFHYTVVSPKTKKARRKSKNDIVVGSVYYLCLRKLTNYTGKIGCSEVLHDVSFEVNGQKVRYISSDVLDAPPVCTENLYGLRYVKNKGNCHPIIK